MLLYENKFEGIETYFMLKLYQLNGVNSIHTIYHSLRALSFWMYVKCIYILV